LLLKGLVNRLENVARILEAKTSGSGGVDEEDVFGVCFCK
jgi:hypothetical protein